MITLYKSNGCQDCRKVKSWLEENQVDYHAFNIETKPLKFPEL